MAVRTLAVVGLVILAGFVISQGYGTEFGLLQGFQGFEDSFPDGNDWGTFGTHEDTRTDSDGRLSLNSEDTGVYTSDIFRVSDGTIIERVEFDGDQMRYDGSNQRRGNLTVQGYRNGGVEEEHTFQITNSPKVIDDPVFDEGMDSYGFQVELERTGGDTSPKLVYVEFEGTTSSRLFSEAVTDIAVQLLLALLLGMALLYGGKALAGSRR